MCLALLRKLSKLSSNPFLLRFSESKNKAAPTKRIQSGLYCFTIYVSSGVGVRVLYETFCSCTRCGGYLRDPLVACLVILLVKY